MKTWVVPIVVGGLAALIFNLAVAVLRAGPPETQNGTTVKKSVTLEPGRVLILENAETGGNLTVSYQGFNGVQFTGAAGEAWLLSVRVSHERGPFLVGESRWEHADTNPSRQNQERRK